MPHETAIMTVSESLMPLVLLVPLGAALAVLLGAPARRTSMLAAWVNLVVTLLLAVSYTGPFHYTMFEVVPALDLKFLVGLDGLSLMMVLLTSIVTLSALWVAPKMERDPGANGFYACLLFIAAGCIGAFVSFDLFFFYAFHELALIPTFLLIGIWGHGEDRVAAAWKITIYLAVGSFVLLVGLLGLYVNLPAAERTFDLTKLATLDHPLSTGAQNWIFPLVLIGFGTLISLFPFHTWAPSAYAAAPTPAAMLHAGVLKKFGLYGLIRIAVPLLPEGMHHWMNLLLVLLAGNILYVGFVTIAQKRLDLMLGYSSVMHMGYIFLGISSLNIIGLSGAATLMFAHGLSIAVLFAVAGEVRARTGTLRMDELGGLARSMPYLALVFGLGLFASIGLPGFANFASEVMVFFGAFASEAHLAKGATRAGAKIFDRHQVVTIIALWGVVMSAVYMLRAYRRVFLGESRVRRDDAPAAPVGAFADLVGGRRWALALLIVSLVVVGFRPDILLDSIKPAIRYSLPAEPSEHAPAAAAQPAFPAAPTDGAAGFTARG